MRPRLSLRDRLYITYLTANVLTLIWSARYWLKATP